jgi:hypothetical protein
MERSEPEIPERSHTAWGSAHHHKPPFNDPRPKQEYVTLCVEVGEIRRFPDYEVIWTVPLTERLRRP